jgi:putative transposase
MSSSDCPVPQRPPPPGFGSHRLRIGRISERNACYFITTKTLGREPLFMNPAAAGVVMRSIAWMETRHRWNWLCYVLMPDHLHLVFKLRQEGPLGQSMKSFKGFTAVRIQETMRRRDPVWQEGYFDHRVRSFEKMEWVAFYCLQNPVRAGLVLDGEEWPFFRCKPSLWRRLQRRHEELQLLEAEKRGWAPQAGE